MTEVIDTHLATKEDIRELEHKIEKLEYRLTIKLGTIMGLGVGVIAAMIKLF